MTRYHLTLKSKNAKTGNIPVSTTSKDTCPDSCPLKSAGCYAKSGPLSINWAAVSNGDRGISFDNFVVGIKSLPRGQLWRHNQAGDLPGENENIDKDSLTKLVNANKGKRGFTFTHKPMTANNAAIVKYANENGFTINLSANNLSHADNLLNLGVAPVASLIPNNSQKSFKTPNGNRVVTCPAQTNDKTTCERCQLCQRANRDFIIGFLPHGAGKKNADKLATTIGG
ncbi:hypothetical protein FJ364_02840 [Candidatus Dependentiae bacterium]|nr:hypothetical protein [Candidatus Dependentiae bacterium]